MQNLVEYCVDKGGLIKPLLVDPKDLIGPSLTNPSVYNDNGQLRVNIRNVNYALYHAEKSKYQHTWGPLVHIHREDDVSLTTNNFIANLDDDGNITEYKRVETSRLDVPPKWEFVGLEDARLVRWFGKLYQIGVRRDTDTTGVGRMEMSHVVGTEVVDELTEISRFRIPAPGKNDSYCEKNWMPIIDQPNRFVKWSNPIEVVEVDPERKSCKTIHLGDKVLPGHKDWRGGSQVVPIGDFYYCLVHETDLWFTETQRKDAVYRHRFIVWDRDWNLVEISREFSFMNANIEFCCGMAVKGENVYISFGYQDNAAFILKTTLDVIERFIDDNI